LAGGGKGVWVGVVDGADEGPSQLATQQANTSRNTPENTLMQRRVPGDSTSPATALNFVVTVQKRPGNPPIRPSANAARLLENPPK